MMIGLLLQLMAIPATMVIPTLCDKLKDPGIMVYAVCTIYGSGMSHSAGHLLAALGPAFTAFLPESREILVISTSGGRESVRTQSLSRILPVRLLSWYEEGKVASGGVLAACFFKRGVL